MDKFELLAIFKESVDVDEAGGGCTGADSDVFAGTNDQEGFVTLAGEADRCYSCRSFIVCQINLLKGGLGIDGIDNVDTGSPVTLRSRIAKFLWRKRDAVAIDNRLAVEQLLFGLDRQGVVV